MIVGSNHLFEEHIFDMFVKRYKNILEKKSKRVSRTYKKIFFLIFSISTWFHKKWLKKLDRIRNFTCKNYVWVLKNENISNLIFKQMSWPKRKVISCALEYYLDEFSGKKNYWRGRNIIHTITILMHFLSINTSHRRLYTMD